MDAPSQIRIMTDEYTATSSYNREYNDYVERQRYDDYMESPRHDDYFDTSFWISRGIGGFFILWMILSLRKD